MCACFISSLVCGKSKTLGAFDLLSDSNFLQSLDSAGKFVSSQL